MRAVADIGGTHARLARLDADGSLGEVVVYHDDPAGLLGVVQRWLREHPGPPLRELALAVAAPVDGDEVRLTNRDWRFSRDDLGRRLALDRLLVLNDFEAVARALPAPAERLVHLGGPAHGAPEAPTVVMGPGTGLGIAQVVPCGDAHQVVPTEGGHVALAACDPEEARLLARLRGQCGWLSWESVLSGPGLVRLYRVLATDSIVAEPAEVTRAAEDGDPEALEAIRWFLRLLGRAAGDAALLTGARGGVVLTGGVLEHLLPWLDERAFRAAFEAKGPMRAWVEQVPTWRLVDPWPGLRGAAAALTA